jgi:ATP-dependent Clp protease protease subunit
MTVQVPVNEINRNLFLSEEVSNTSTKAIIEKIVEINRIDDAKEKATYNNHDRSKFPIFLTINTPGGSVTSGLGLMDIIRNSKTPVHTIGLGMVASMGIPILLAGHKRYSYEHTVFMFHDISYGQGGTFTEHQRRMEAVEKFMRSKVNKFVLERTNIRADEIANMQDTVKDWYFDTDEAIKLGVVESKIAITRLKREDVQAGNFAIE